MHVYIQCETYGCLCVNLAGTTPLIIHVYVQKRSRQPLRTMPAAKEGDSRGGWGVGLLYMCIYIYIYVCVYIYMHVYIYTYLYIYVCLHTIICPPILELDGLRDPVDRLSGSGMAIRRGQTLPQTNQPDTSGRKSLWTAHILLPLYFGRGGSETVG